jgi:rubredoxin
VTADDKLATVQGAEPGDPSPESEKPQFHYPGFLPEGEEPEGDFVFLCTAPGGNVQRVCEHLEAAGVPCKIARPTSEGDTELSILVPSELLHTAQVALTTATTPEEDALYTPEMQFERKLDNWICPRCDARELKAMPLQGNWKRVQLGWILLLAVPVAAMVASSGAEPGSELEMVENPPGWFFIPWVLAVGVIGVLLVTADRTKKCAKCGWRSDSTERYDSASRKVT